MLWAMTSIWQSSAMVSSPRNPSSTMRIFVFCRILLTRCPANILDRLGGPYLSCLRFLFHLHSPTGYYDETEILSYAIPLSCFIGADVRQSNSLTTGSRPCLFDLNGNIFNSTWHVICSLFLFLILIAVG